jgi:uncharacterized protein (UPF0548 family)
MFRTGTVSSAKLFAIAEAQSELEVTYSPTAATLTGSLPSGYHHDRYETMLGDAPGTFQRACDGLRGWQAHIGAGLHVEPRNAPSVGLTVVVAIRLGPITAIAPCRIVAVVDELHRFGFAYGTLPGHPESGEEAFTIDDTGQGVVFQIVAFSRPAAPLARLGAPVSRRIQIATTRHYLDALARWVGLPPQSAGS